MLACHGVAGGMWSSCRHFPMSLLKRFELWVLLMLIGGGLWYVFNLEDDESGRARIPIAAEGTASLGQAEPAPRFSLQKTTLTRDGDHFLAEIEVHCRNDRQQVLELGPPGTRLLAAGGQEAPVFFLPFQPPAKIPASGEMDVTLRYWLSYDEINGPLSLLIGKDTIPVKVGGFEIGMLADKQSRSFPGTAWKSKPD